MKEVLFISTNLNISNPLFEEIRSRHLDRILINIVDETNFVLTKLRTEEISCLIFDGINLCDGFSFSSNIVDFIKMLSDNKKFDLKKIVVKFKPFDQNYFREYEGRLINLGVLEENIFENNIKIKEVATAVVKILNS